jgi:hypothetical protein
MSGERNRLWNHAGRDAFTLIELPVVSSIIAFWRRPAAPLLQPPDLFASGCVLFFAPTSHC